MHIRKSLSLLILFSLLISMVPAPLLAAQPPASLQQPEGNEGQESFLLIVTPPDVRVAQDTSPAQAADQVMIAYARRFAEVQAELARLRAEGAIASYSAVPNAYVFQIAGAVPAAQSGLAGIGHQMEIGEVGAAAALQNLESAHANKLNAAVQRAVADAPVPVTPDRPLVPVAPPVEQRPELSNIMSKDEPAVLRFEEMREASIASGNPRMSIILYKSDVAGNGFTPFTEVTATLKSSAGVVKSVSRSGASESGFFEDDFYDESWNSVPVMPGDTVEVQGQDQPLITVTAVNLTAKADPATNRVTGMAPANIASTDLTTPPVLKVQVRNQQYVTTDSTGVYIANNIGDFWPGDEGYIQYTHAAGHNVYLYFTVPIVIVGLYQSAVRVDGVGNNVPATATVKSGAGIVRGVGHGTGSGYIYLDDIYKNDVMVMPGDVVEVEMPDKITVPAVNMTALANPLTDRVNGMAPPNITSTDTMTLPVLDVLVYGYGQSQLVTTDSSGAFQADDVGDFRPGDLGRIDYVNTAGHVVRLEFNPPVVLARGGGPLYAASYEAESYVSGAAPYGNQLVTVALNRGGAAFVTNYVRASSRGNYSLDLVDIYSNQVAILPGDQIVASAVGSTSAVTVPTFAVQSNPETDQVTGTTDAVVVTDTVGAPQSLAVWPTDLDDWGYGKHVLLQGNAFTAENPFYAAANPSNEETPLDWDPGGEGHLRYLDAEGDGVYYRFAAPSGKPVVNVRGTYEGYEADHTVSGFTNGFCGAGIVRLKNSAGDVKAQNTAVNACPEFNASFLDAYNNPVPIMAGDQVEAIFGGQTTNVTVPSFAITSNAETDTVSGVTNAAVTTTTFGANQSLAIYPESLSIYDSDMQNALPEAGGAFTANFAGMVDIQPGVNGQATYIDNVGNSIFTKFQAPYATPIIRLRGADGYTAENYVYLQLPYSGGSYYPPLRLVVKNSTGAVRFDRTYQASGGGSWSQYLYDDFGQPVNINAGDVVEATYVGQTASMQAPGFSVASDAINDRVSGTITGAAVITTGVGMTQTLAVWPEGLNQWGYGKHVLAPGGAFVAENPFFTGYTDNDYWPRNLDWDQGDAGHLRYIDARNNRVYARFAAMVEQTKLTIDKGTAQIEGITPYANSWVTVTVRSGGSVRGVANVMTDATGFFAAQVYDGNGAPVLIEAGDVVQAAGASMTVPQITMAVNADTDTVTGTGPANSLLGVSANEEDGLTVITDGAGAWSADFRGRVDIRPGNAVEVQHKNLDGHRVLQAQVVGPQISALLNTNWVWGWALEPNAPALVVVKNGATVKGMAAIHSDRNAAFFDAYPTDATGRPVALAPGDVVEVDFGGGRVHSLTLANLSIGVDVTADQVNGIGPANQSVWAGISPSWEGYIFSATAPADGTGRWSINLGASGIDLRPGDLVDARYTANGADFTWLFGAAPVHYVTIGDNSVVGFVGNRATVNVVLKRDGVVVAGRQAIGDGDGYYSADLFDTFGNAVSIVSGDVIEITASPTVTITVPVLQATHDLATRIVGGVGPANALLGVSYSGGSSSGSQTVQTDSTGAFSADLSAATDVSSILVRYREQGGNWIRLNVPPSSASGAPYLWAARWNNAVDEYASNAVSGRASVANQRVTVVLKRNGATVASATAFADSGGYFTALFRNNAGEPIPINAGDVLELNAAAVSVQAAATSYTVADVTVQTNQQSGTIFGTGPANKQLQVDGDCDTSTMIDLAGSYVAQCDLYPGATGYLFVRDDNGARTYADWSLPLVGVRQLGNYVYGWVALGVPVTVQLQRGGVIVATITTTSQNYNGYFNASFLNATGQPVVIQPNDVVVVTAGSVEAQSAATGQDVVTVPVTPMTAQVNTAAGTVTGAGPANAMLTVWVYSNNNWSERNVTTAADGSFTADYRGLVDLRPGDDVEVWYRNPDGNRVYLFFRTPMVRINLSSDIVDGYATPLAMATLVLKRSGATLATTTVQTDGSGFLSAFFTNSSGTLVDIQVGDIVEVTASPTTTLAAINLTATLDPVTDRVTGIGPANAPILVQVGVLYGLMSKSVFANASGVYTADFSEETDLNEESYAFVTALDAGSNQTTVSTQPVVNAALQNVERQILDAGASLLGSAAGVVNEGNLTPPLQIVANGGRLLFAAQNGALVVTAPDGSVSMGLGNYFVVSQAMVGVWSVQVQVSSDDGQRGIQYAVAAGDIKYSLYLPVTAKQ